MDSMHTRVTGHEIRVTEHGPRITSVPPKSTFSAVLTFPSGLRSVLLGHSVPSYPYGTGTSL